MFDIGFWELTIIAIVGLVVIGPDKLPDVARTAGKWVGRARRFVNDVKTDIDREIKQEELRKALAEDAGLDEIKEIMNTDRFTLEPEEEPEYQVKAMPDDEKAESKEMLDSEASQELLGNSNDSGHGEYEPIEETKSPVDETDEQQKA